uniref:Dof-type domain-containing protein n=1 Tax=Setaria digitata TaxID=48799 RepID=A0A915PNR2_9BILA
MAAVEVVKSVISQKLMPREACEFCRRARNRHKTNRKAKEFWCRSRRFRRDSAEWKNKKSQQRPLPLAVLAKHDGSRGSGEISDQVGVEINPKLKGLVDLFEKENEIEEVPSPENSGSIVLESAKNIEAVEEHLLRPTALTYPKDQLSRDTVLVKVSKPTEKPSLEHFKIPQTILQQCSNLLH